MCEGVSLQHQRDRTRAGLKPIALRIDVDTYRGTREGVPRLLDILAREGIRATFFLSVGPDNMGRHLWRLLKPKFLMKMLRSNAASLYGWDILFAGTAWPGRLMGKGLAPIMRRIVEAGHEVGLHAWDHHAWQAWSGRWDVDRQYQEIKRGVDVLEQIIGEKISCSAVPGWRGNQATVEAKERFGFRYNSDCRGEHMFRPLLGDGTVGTPQIPVDLPTFDEVIGRETDNANFNGYILEKLRSSLLGVYTIHAEVEGIVQASEFSALIHAMRQNGMDFVPQGAMLPDDLSTLPTGYLTTGALPGREGWVGRSL